MLKWIQSGFASPKLLKCAPISSSISTSGSLSQEQIQTDMQRCHIKDFSLAEMFATVKIWKQLNIQLGLVK